MKTELKITTAAAGLLLLSGCDHDNTWTAQRDTAICVDKAGNRVPDNQCARPTGYYGGGGSNAFLWYYLGRSSGIPAYGEHYAGGSFARTPGASYYRAPATTAMTRATYVSRGGFGGSAHAFSAGS